MDSPQASLILNQERNEDQADHEPATPSTRLDAGKARIETKPGAFVLLLTLSAGISGLLFGYDTGVISATLVSIGTSLSDRALTSFDKSIITSATALFALIASPLSSLLADKVGRKPVILLGDILFVAGALAQACSSTVGWMIAGRCIIGAAVGAASFVVPLYIAEVSPASHRGRLVTTNVLFITLGQMIAYIIGWLFSTFGNDAGWRWMVGLGAIPAVFQGLLIVFMPETPRWLVKVGRSTAARLVVHRVNGERGSAGLEEADLIVKEIEAEAREELEIRRTRERRTSGSSKWLGAWYELTREGKNRRALAIACLLQGLQQLCGFNSLMYFSATIFMLVGFQSPTLTSLTVAITNFVFTLAALALIDRIGRRRVLLWSLPFMILGLILASLGFSRLELGQTSDVTSTVAADNDTNRRPAGMILLSIMVYVAAYALGLGNVPWMQSELFPLSVRSLGSGIATGANWGANFIIGLTFLPLMDVLTPEWTFVLYALICAGGYVLVWKIYPETAGLTLEESTALLENGWGVT